MRYLAHVYVSASRKLRLQCAAVYCLSWLFSPELPVARLPPSFSSSSFLLLSATYYLPVGRLSFLLGARREVVTLGSNGLLYLGDGNGGRLFTPTGVERVAIPRGEPPWSCKSYEQVIKERRRKAMESREDWGEKKGENVRSSFGNANRPPCIICREPKALSTKAFFSSFSFIVNLIMFYLNFSSY